MTYVKCTSNNNQTINETNKKYAPNQTTTNHKIKKTTHQLTKPTNKQKKTNQSKQQRTTNQKTTKQTKRTIQPKRELFLPKTNSPAGFSTSTRCISSEPGQDLWEWYIFCLPPKQEQPQIGLNVVYLSHGSSGLANELFHPYMSRICDTSRGNKLTN